MVSVIGTVALSLVAMVLCSSYILLGYERYDSLYCLITLFHILKLLHLLHTF